jgi:MFS family permease
VSLRLQWTLPAGLAALRERNFVLYVVGLLTSQLGQWIEVTAVSWILYEMTGSPMLLGLNGLFRATPFILLALVGGVVADRIPRRTMLMITESTMLVMSLLIGVLAATDHLLFWHLYLLSLVSGTVAAFSGPARHALMAGLVPRTALQSAVTLHVVGLRSGMLIGPSIGGLMLAYGGRSLPFFVNAVSFIGMIVALRAMQLTAPIAEEAPPRTSILLSVKEGLRFVWSSAALKVALSLEIMTGLFGYNSTLVTIFSRDILHAGPQGLGLLFSALGAGGLLGMAAMMSFRVQRHARLILLFGILYVALWTGFGLATRGSGQLGHVQGGAAVSLVGGPAATLVGAGIIACGVFISSRVLARNDVTPPV